MAQKIPDTPALPYPPSSLEPISLAAFDQDLVKALFLYLSTTARRINDSLQKDGSEPMEGDLDMGGFDIVNAGSIAGNTTGSHNGPVGDVTPDTGDFTDVTADEIVVVGDVAAATFNGLDLGTMLVETKVTVFTSDGTFTPDARMVECEVWAWGGGGGGGAVSATNGSLQAVASGGNGGALAYGRFTAADIGSSQSVDIGAGGSSASAGSVTTLGSLLSAKGGEAGVQAGPAAVTSSFGRNPTQPTQSATGTVRGWTVTGSIAYAGPSAANVQGGCGGSTIWGGAGPGADTAGAVGNAAQANTGSGGGGAAAINNASTFAGGAGGSGIMIIKEYLVS